MLAKRPGVRQSSGAFPTAEGLVAFGALFFGLRRKPIKN